MKKKTIYFLQSIIVYFFYFISKIIGLKLSRIIFSFIFVKAGNIFKSKKIIINNLNRISPKISNFEKDNITLSYKNVPIIRFSANDYGYSKDDVSIFKEAVLESLGDDSFIKEVLGSQSKNKFSAVTDSFPELKKYTF